MSSFCEQVWQENTTLRTAIHGLPFNRELAAGTLSTDRFRFYIIQDALYLEQYARILALAGVRGPDGETLRLFGACALEAVAVEQALHADYLRRFAADPSGVKPFGADPSPECLGYTSFLLATAYHEPWPVLMAALLPCFWLYWDVGNAIAKQAAANNPYQAWIDTYSDAAFGEAVRKVVAATDLAAATVSPDERERMKIAFRRSCQYEYLFWDGAYQKRGWPG